MSEASMVTEQGAIQGGWWCRGQSREQYKGGGVQGTEVWQYQYLGSHCLDPPIHPPVLGPDTEIPDPVGGTVPLHPPALEGALHPSNLDPRGKQGQ